MLTPRLSPPPGQWLIVLYECLRHISVELMTSVKKNINFVKCHHSLKTAFRRTSVRALDSQNNPLDEFALPAPLWVNLVQKRYSSSFLMVPTSLSNFNEIESKSRPKVSPKEIFGIQFFKIYSMPIFGDVSCPWLPLNGSRVLKIDMAPFIMGLIPFCWV